MVDALSALASAIREECQDHGVAWRQLYNCINKTMFRITIHDSDKIKKWYNFRKLQAWGMYVEQWIDEDEKERLKTMSA